MAKIPPKMLEPLSNAIGDRFTFLELDAILYRCAGDKIINDIANPQEPLRVIARKCIDGVEARGYTKSFLAYIVASRVDAADLRTVVGEAFPDALIEVPDLKSQVGGVISALEQAQRKLDDPAVRKAIGQSKETLEFVVRELSRLDGYKNLHDSLHRIQLRQFSILLSSARTMDKDDAQIDSLREYQEQVQTTVESARLTVERLPNEPAVRSLEMKWINELDGAVTIYQKAIDDRDGSRATAATYKFGRVLETHPPRLNELIFAAAKALPLAQLSAALKSVVPLAGAEGAAISEAQAALENLAAALRSRVAEHDMWQGIDSGLWSLDKVFSQSANQTDDFISLWPETRSSVRTLADLNLDAKWAKNIRDYADRIEDELARLGTKTAPADGVPEKNNLGRLYDDFRRSARMRFFYIDELLKQDCGSLVEIGGPLRSILKALSDDA